MEKTYEGAAHMTELLRPPQALVLAAPGINRGLATEAAYQAAGARAEVVHINQLENQEISLSDYQILSIPGGFSYGDHIQSGRILALRLQRNNLLTDQIYEHLRKGRIILGVCNGFQVLIQSGLLPFGNIHQLNENVATLTHNRPQQFQSRWIQLQPIENRCSYIETSNSITLPVAHGEGRFLASNEVVHQLFEDHQVVYQYCDANGDPTLDYPDNPNASICAIAAICDPSGQILGMMPHAEDFVRREHHPNWRREQRNIDGLRFFQNIVRAAKDL